MRFTPAIASAVAVSAALSAAAPAHAATISVPKTAKVTEGKVVSVKVKLAKKAARTVKVKWSLPKGSAFKTRRGTVRIKKGARSATLRLTALQDKLVNGNRNVTLKIGARKVALTLVDDDKATAGGGTSTPQPAPTATASPQPTTTPAPSPQPTATPEPTPTPVPVKISIADLQRSESAIAFPKIQLDAPSSAPVTVHWETVDGTAKAGTDYSKASGNATFQPGKTSLDLPVSVVNDLAHEQNETFTIKLSAPNGAVIADDEATITIADDDPKPAVSIGDGTPRLESNTTMPFQVSLDRLSYEPVTVKVSTSGGTATGGPFCSVNSDYISLNGLTVTIPAGQTQKQVVVTICEDALTEADETIGVSIHDQTNATLGDSTGSGTIQTDND